MALSKITAAVFLLFLFVSCNNTQDVQKVEVPYLMVLGNTQDAGSPQLGCKKACCVNLSPEAGAMRMVSALGIAVPKSASSILFDATPDIIQQLNLLQSKTDIKLPEVPSASFLTHAHIGHYTGLMYYGRESLSADKAQVYTMPRMANFLTNNGPWSQLVELNNIELQQLSDSTEVSIGDVTIKPFLVPHRDEFSETVGYEIVSVNKSILFIPDIDKWEKWQESIVEKISEVDYAFLDATFYDEKEIGYRDISEIPHPFVIESMKLFDPLPNREKSKIFFIHMNHTNPLLRTDSYEYKQVISNGYNVAAVGDTLHI